MQFRVSPKALEQQQRRGMAGAGRSRRRAPAGLQPGIFRRHLQPSDLRGAGPHATATTRSRSARIGPKSRPPASWKSASMMARSSAARARSSAPAIASTRRSTRRCRRRRRCFTPTCRYASALTRLEDPRIKEIGQTEVGLSGAIAYDDEYTGPALDPAEGARLAGVIGDKKVLFMANHGISTVGATVAEAYDMLYYVERAAQVQIYAMWTGQKLKQLPAARGRKDPARLPGRSSLQGPDAGPAALRCAEADAGPQGAGLRDVVFFVLAAIRGISPMWAEGDAAP